MKLITIFFTELYYYETDEKPAAVKSAITKMIDESDDLEGNCAGDAFKFRYYQYKGAHRSVNNAARIKGNITISENGKTAISIRIRPGYSFIYYSMGIAFFAYAVTEGMWQGPDPSKAIALAALILFLYLFSWFYAFQSKALIKAAFENAIGVQTNTSSNK